MSRTCTICEHPERVAIEAELTAGESNRRTAARYALSEAAVRRHRADHVSQSAEPAENIPQVFCGLVDASELTPLTPPAVHAQLEQLTFCTCGNGSSFLDDDGVRRCFLCRQPFPAA